MLVFTGHEVNNRFIRSAVQKLEHFPHFKGTTGYRVMRFVKVMNRHFTEGIDKHLELAKKYCKVDENFLPVYEDNHPVFLSKEAEAQYDKELSEWMQKEWFVKVLPIPYEHAVLAQLSPGELGAIEFFLEIPEDPEPEPPAAASPIPGPGLMPTPASVGEQDDESIGAQLLSAGND